VAAHVALVGAFAAARVGIYLTGVSGSFRRGRAEPAGAGCDGDNLVVGLGIPSSTDDGLKPAATETRPMPDDRFRPPDGVVPEDLDPLFRDLADAAASWLGADPTGHGLAHAWRVFDTAMALADEYPDADRTVLGAAALVHDVHRAMSLEAGEYVHPGDSLEEVGAVLAAADVPLEKRDAILHCVALHEEYDFRGDRRDGDRLEVDLLRDADNLDAMGAVGIARCFAYTGAHGGPMWTDDGEDAIDHVETKLLNLTEEMHTEAARAVAEERHAFLESYLERFRAECRGQA
jgi:uncharacterized protein